MNGAGYIKLHRKSKKSAVFAHDGLWKLFCLCLMKAAWEPKAVSISGIINPVQIDQGQFITGRYSLHFDYHQGATNPRYRETLAPSALTLFRWLKRLETMGILNIKSYSKFSIITVINWNLYQAVEHQPEHQLEHKEEECKEYKEKTPIDFSEIERLKKRFSDQRNIERVFNAIRSTRKSGKVATSILLKLLKSCERFPVDQVESGMRIYLEKGCAEQGKGEKYLMGIIRNQKPEPEPPKTTGSIVLDAYYAANPT